MFRKQFLCLASMLMVLAALTPAIAQAEEPPPVGYSNGKELSATHTAIAAWGPISLTSTTIKTIQCTNSFYGAAWNEGSPKVGKGLVEGWGTNQCTDPEGIKSQEASHEKELKENKIKCATPGAAIGEGKCITVFASAEMPIEPELREAEVCIEETKKLSQCPETSEREKKKLTVVARRAVSSLPWDVELERCERSEKAGVCQHTGIPTAEEKSKGNTTCYKLKNGLAAPYAEVPAGCIKLNLIFPEIPFEVVLYGSQSYFMVNGVKDGLNPSKLKFIESGTLDSPENAAGEGTTTGEVKYVGAESVQLVTAK